MSIRKQTPELKDRLKNRQDNKSKYQVTPEMIERQFKRKDCHSHQRA